MTKPKPKRKALPDVRVAYREPREGSSLRKLQLAPDGACVKRPKRKAREPHVWGIETTRLAGGWRMADFFFSKKMAEHHAKFYSEARVARYVRASK